MTGDIDLLSTLGTVRIRYQRSYSLIVSACPPSPTSWMPDETATHEDLPEMVNQSLAVVLAFPFETRLDQSRSPEAA